MYAPIAIIAPAPMFINLATLIIKFNVVLTMPVMTAAVITATKSTIRNYHPLLANNFHIDSVSSSCSLLIVVIMRPADSK